MKGKNTAIVLSAGSGRRMRTNVQKQYLMLCGYPVLYYSLKVFQECPFIDEIILVAGKEDIEYCRQEFVEKYHITKIVRIVPGGAERYHSVYQGLLAADECGYVYIHDGARPFPDGDMLERARDAAGRYGACVLGMPVKDTIKIADQEGFARATPARELVWQIQTPQVFSYQLIRGAYEKMFRELENGAQWKITDDAMIVEAMTDCRVKLVPGAYTNIKITTPEDMQTAEVFVKNENQNER